MKTIFNSTASFLLIFLFTCSTGNQNWSLEFRIAHDEPAPGLTEYVFEKTGEVFYLEGKVHLSNQNIESTSVVNLNHGYGIELKLNDEGTEKFRQLTASNINKRVAMLLNNELISAPIVRDTITQGIAIISGLFTEDEAESIAKGLNK